MEERQKAEKMTKRVVATATSCPSCFFLWCRVHQHKVQGSEMVTVMLTLMRLKGYKVTGKDTLNYTKMMNELTSNKV